MSSRSTPEKADDSDEDADDEFESGDGGHLFSCPFCGSEDDGCPHFLGSRDLNFCGEFSVDEAGRLDELGEEFGELGESVVAFLQAGRKKARIATLKPRRLRDLAQAVADGNENDGFTQYVEQVGKDTKIAVSADSYSESGGPGMSSTVQMYWAADVPAALAGMRKRIEQDTRRLQE